MSPNCLSPRHQPACGHLRADARRASQTTALVRGSKHQRPSPHQLGRARPVVVLLHGSGTTATQEKLGYARQRDLGSRFRSCCLTVAATAAGGYGRSPDVKQNDCAQAAKDVAALMTQIEGVRLAGHSSGAVVVMLAAAALPGAVRSLTLIEPGRIPSGGG
ncbi:MAG: alpha/beta fold hydrolase [Egibacteraceae bacterium]